MVHIMSLWNGCMSRHLLRTSPVYTIEKILASFTDVNWILFDSTLFILPLINLLQLADNAILLTNFVKYSLNQRTKILTPSYAS